MAKTSDISPAIVEALYEEALSLADEARAAFDRGEQWGNWPGVPRGEGQALAFSSEALRTTTRMMHALAWLLNQRAFFRGEMSEFSLRRHGRLPDPQPEADPAQTELLPPDIRLLVTRTKGFYARLGRLDAAWRRHFAMEPSAVERLRRRIGARMEA